MSHTDKLYLAPFQGITGMVFRDIYTKYFVGIDKLFTPFFTGIYKRTNLNTRYEELKNTHHHQVPLVPQILSKDPYEMIRFARFCSERGFTEINWNLGCPFPRVANKKRGSGMLPYPDLVKEILTDVHDQLPLKLSVKCRLGYHNADEIFDLIPIFNCFNISELIIHARIGKQLYEGEVDTLSFKRCIDLCEMPIVYNGDIFSLEDLKEFKENFTNLNAWMIGRGLLIDPFLPGDIKGSEVLWDDRKLTIEKFVTELFLAYRKRMNNRLQAINVMKELWGFLCYSFDAPDKVFNKIKKCKSFDAYEQVVADTFKSRTWLGANARKYKKS